MMSMMKLLPWLMLSWCFAFIMFSNVALVAGDGDPPKCDQFKAEIIGTTGNLILQHGPFRYDDYCHENDKLCVMYVCKKDGKYWYGSGCRMRFQGEDCGLTDEDVASAENEVAGTCGMFGTGIYQVCEGFECGLQFNECVRSKQTEDPPLSIGDGMTLDKIQLDNHLDPTTTPVPEPVEETTTPTPEPENETTKKPPPEPEQETTTPTLEPETPPMPTTTDVPTTTSAAQPTTTKVPTKSSTEKKKPIKSDPAESTTTTAGAKENFTILKLSAAIIFCAFGLAFA